MTSGVAVPPKTEGSEGADDAPDADGACAALEVGAEPAVGVGSDSDLPMSFLLAACGALCMVLTPSPSFPKTRVYDTVTFSIMFWGHLVTGLIRWGL